MKTRKVYVVNSTDNNVFLIFGTRKRATEWIEKSFDSGIFDKSDKSNLFITSRRVF